MTSYVENLINQPVQVITNEGRVFIGELLSFDQSMNVMLKSCIEKIYSEDKGVKFEKMGLLNAVITQNIDNLHQKAGSKNVIELHGTSMKNFCTK